MELVSLTQLEVVHTARLNGAEGIYNLIRLDSQLEIGWCTDVGFGITKVRYQGKQPVLEISESTTFFKDASISCALEFQRDMFLIASHRESNMYVLDRKTGRV